MNNRMIVTIHISSTLHLCFSFSFIQMFKIQEIQRVRLFPSPDGISRDLSRERYPWPSGTRSDSYRCTPFLMCSDQRISSGGEKYWWACLSSWMKCHRTVSLISRRWHQRQYHSSNHIEVGCRSLSYLRRSNQFDSIFELDQLAHIW